MIVNNRELVFVDYSTERNWAEDLPKRNWLCILVDDNRPRSIIVEVLSEIIEHDVCYVCTIGQACEKNHDLLDEEIVFRDVDVDNLYLPKHQIMTTWHTDYEEGVWFAVHAANDGENTIEKIVVLDLTGVKLKEIKKLMEGFQGADR